MKRYVALLWLFTLQQYAMQENNNDELENIVHTRALPDGNFNNLQAVNVLIKENLKVNGKIIGSGSKGATGATGGKGATGSLGTAGSAGAVGGTGITGTQGATASTGAQGVVGGAGADGTIGFIGAAGSTGGDGNSGSAGDDGEQGSTGSAGSSTTGAAGSDGAQGDTGETGANGDTGSTGTVGQNGDTGAAGSQGQVGTAGVLGATGVTGSTGAVAVGVDAFSTQLLTSAGAISTTINYSSIENYTYTTAPIYTLAAGTTGSAKYIALANADVAPQQINTNRGSFYLTTSTRSVAPLIYMNFQWNFLTTISTNSYATWFVTTQQAGGKTIGTGAVGNARQGNWVAVAADGNTMASGANADNGSAGAVWIFTGTTGAWVQQGSKLVGTGAVGAAQQGIRVALSSDGNTLASGGQQDNVNVGATWIFTRSVSTWTQQGSKLIGTGATGSARQGSSVALSADGNTLASGGVLDSAGMGATWIFIRSGGVWSQQGSKLVGTGGASVLGVNQGASVALSADGNTLAIGGPNDEVAGVLIGAVWIFVRSGGVWTQQGSKLVGTGNIGGSSQGTSVALSADGNTLAIGGPSDNTSVGAVWIFTRSGTTWTQQGSKLIGTGATGSARQGSSVSLSSDGNMLASGGTNDNTNVGAVWLFTRSNGTWSQQGSKFVGTGAVGTSRQGSSVALSASGNLLVEGGPTDNSSIGAVWTFV